MTTETETEPTCTCVILNAPLHATTSMWLCLAHGEPEDLNPLPGQGLRYSLLIEMAGTHTLIGPLTTADGVENAKFFVKHLGYTVHGVLPMTALVDLQQLATLRGVQDAPPPGKSKLPANLTPTVVHEPGCRFADQEHPGKCYVMAAE